MQYPCDDSNSVQRAMTKRLLITVHFFPVVEDLLHLFRSQLNRPDLHVKIEQRCINEAENRIFHGLGESYSFKRFSGIFRVLEMQSLVIKSNSALRNCPEP
jgi:hypothetical protein